MEYVDVDLNNLDVNNFAGIDVSGLMAYVGIMSLAAVIISILYIIELWKVYKKCNKPGWAAIVPIYNVWVFLEIAGLPGWLVLIPVANIIGMLVAMFKIPKRFGKSGAFGIGMLFLPLIFMGILAFSKAKTDSDLGTVESAPAVDTPVAPVAETLEVKQNMESTPDLMATDTTPVAEPTIPTEMPKPAMVEEPALNVEETTIEEPVVNVEPVVPSEPVNEPISEVNAFEMPTPAMNNEPETLSDTEVLEEDLELPKMANEAINSDISATKTCTICGHVNAYTNKTCEICGASLE